MVEDQKYAEDYGKIMEMLENTPEAQLIDLFKWQQDDQYRVSVHLPKATVNLSRFEDLYTESSEMEENYQKSSVATHGSKFAVVNARRLTGLQQSVQNKFAWNVIQQVIRASGFELSKNSTVKVDEESRFLAVLKICCKWNYVSSIKNLPDHIVGTVECTSQIKDNYFNNSKEANRYFSDRLNTFSDNKDYIKASKEDEVLIQLHTFSKHADEELEKYYRYHTTPSDLFNSLLTLSKTHLTHPFSTLHTLLTTTTCPTPEYSNPSTSLTLTTIINCMNSTHATYLLHNFSTLSDIETLFTLPYKIDFQKHEFNEKLKDILALALFNFQLTYMRGQDEQHASLIGKC